MRQMLRSAVMILVLVPGLATLLHAGVVTFNFDTDTTGTITPFTDTNGLSATFTTSPDAGGFMVASIPGFFQNLTGNFLIDSTPESLTIVFSALQASISMNFATSGAGTLSLSAFNGATPVGSSSASGTVPAGFTLPEGVLGLSGAGTFNTVVLSATTANFAIDNVTVSDSAVPEPGSLLLCAGALTALSLVRLRRRIS